MWGPSQSELQSELPQSQDPASEKKRTTENSLKGGKYDQSTSSALSKCHNETVTLRDLHMLTKELKYIYVLLLRVDSEAGDLHNIFPKSLGQQMIKNSLFTYCHLVTEVRKLWTATTEKENSRVFFTAPTRLAMSYFTCKGGNNRLIGPTNGLTTQQTCWLLSSVKVSFFAACLLSTW